MKRLVLILGAVIALLGVSIPAAFAQWPTSCVELNDLIEAGRGNDHNVGIYQRVYGDQAEAVCRSEHRDSGFRFDARPYQLPARSDPAAYTQALVERAIARYNNDGLQATLDYYNSSQSLDGQWYVFIFDENDVLVAHAPTPSIVGLHARDVIGSDRFPTGLQVVADATPEGAWTSYSWINPDTGEAESKHSWVVRYDGLVFGSGWYEPGQSKDNPPAYAQALVQQAVTLYESVGTEDTLSYYNLPESADGPWYVFAIEDRAGVLYSVANANRPDIVGTTRERIDANGFNYGEAFAAVTEEGGGEWVSYLFTHPQTREDAPKHTWIVRRDNLLFGAGWYEPAVSKDDPAAYTQAFVQRALNRYEMVGLDGALSYYNSPQSIDGPWYVFIQDETTEIVAHAARPERLGLTSDDQVDIRGFHYGALIAAVPEGEGRWVSYWFRNPTTGEDQQKHSWVVRRDGLLFGSGWYEPAVSKDDPAAYTQAFVRRALDRYDAEGRQATIDYYNSPESVDGPWYVFIQDETTAIVAHGTRPERLGLTSDDQVDIRGFHYGALIAAVPEGEGRWVSYWFRNPTTGKDQQKHSWVVRHDGLLFGSGWYEE